MESHSPSTPFVYYLYIKQTSQNPAFWLLGYLLAHYHREDYV